MTGVRARDLRYRLPIVPLLTDVAGPPRAEAKLGDKLHGSITAEQHEVAPGIVSTRAMINLKMAF